jgi:hypothetical protein
MACWTESPGDTYARGIVATITSQPIDLSGVTDPWVRFYHQHLFEDVATRMATGGALQVSTDGTNFTTLARYFDSAHPWRPAAVSLADYAGQPAFRLRLRFHSDLFASLADGWHIDDVEVYQPDVPIPDPSDFVVEAYHPFGLNAPPLYAESGGAWFFSVSKAVDASLRSPNARYNLLDELRDSTARFTPIFPADGLYEVFAIWGISANANHVRYTIRHAQGESVAFLDQNGNANPHRWLSLGAFPFQRGRSSGRGSVTVDDMTVTDLPVPAGEGRVYADAIRFVYRDRIEWDASAWMLH